MAFWAKLKSQFTHKWVDRSRLKIVDQDKISFFIKDESTEVKKLRVQNISVGGIGLAAEDFPNADLTRNIEAELRIASNNHFATFKVFADVAHINEKTVGLRFSMVTPEFEMALEQYFKAELLGTRLKLVDKKYLKAENDVFPVWLTDGRGNEIYVLANEGAIQSFHMSFLGHYIEGGAGKTLRVGHISSPEADEDKMNLHKGSDVITMEPRAQEASLAIAREFVINAKAMEPELTTTLLAQLRSPNLIGGISN